VRNLPYLADVARFEWALNIAATVREAAPLAGGGARRGSSAAGRIRRAAPAAVAQLFRLVLADRRDLAGQQRDEVPPIDLASGGASLEIRRAGEAVGWRRLDPGTFAFRTALADGLVLAAAMAAATLRDPCFDLTTALRHVSAKDSRSPSSSHRNRRPRMIARSAALGERSSLAVRLRQAIALLDRFPPSLLQLMFRVAIAAVFWSSGLTKNRQLGHTIALFRDEYMVPLLPPEIAAVMSATFELSCSALIVVGLATRLATLPLLSMTFVIEVFVYPEYWAMHLMWASVLLFC